MSTSEAPPREDPLRRSVVKLFTVTRKQDFYQPWAFGYQRTSGGSACIVPGNRILTNAHVVTDAVYVHALKYGDVKKYTCKVEHVSHDSELALLSVEDDSFFEGTTPVSFGRLPFRQDKLRVYGYPIGGNELCVTEGVVSRIEVVSYTHSQRALLAIQTDAAINPGNSGGPVFMEGELVGVAFQAHERSTARDVGYVVPMPVIEHFFADVKSGQCQGVPALGAYWQKIENDALRAYLKMHHEQTGVLVTRVVHGSSADGVLREGDVVLAIDGRAVERDGSVQLRGEDRVTFSHLVSQHRVGERAQIEVLRSGEEHVLDVELKKPRWLVPRPQHGKKATYYLFAGLLFVPLDWEHLAVWDWKEVDPRFRHLFRNGLPSEDRRGIVVLSQVLAHAVNQGYHQIRGAIVDRINGVRIGDMADVPRALGKPIGEHHVIEIDNHAGDGTGSDYHASFGTHVVLRADEIAEATKEILSRYGIPADRSSDLEGL